MLCRWHIMAPKTLASRSTNQQADWEVLNDTCVLGFTSQDTLKRGLNDTKAAQRWRRVTLFETQNVLGVEVGEAWWQQGCSRWCRSYQFQIQRMLMSCFFLVFLYGSWIEDQSNAVTFGLHWKPRARSDQLPSLPDIFSVWQKEVWNMLVLW